MASEVIMLKFDDTYGAEKAMSAIRALTELDYAWLEDVVIVERHNSGRVSTHTTHGSVAAGAALGRSHRPLRGSAVPADRVPRALGRRHGGGRRDREGDQGDRPAEGLPRPGERTS